MAWIRSGAASPERILTASVGPMPLTPISFSNSAFLVLRQEAVERQRIFAHVGMDAQAHLGAGLGQVREGGNRDGDVVAHAARFDDGLVGMLLQQHAAQQSNHE